MRLHGVRIQNFRCISELELEFTDPETGEALPFVALVGPNGCGKTSILEGIGDLLLGLDGLEPPLRGASHAGLKLSFRSGFIELNEGVLSATMGDEGLRPIHFEWNPDIEKLRDNGGDQSLFIPAGRDPWIEPNLPIAPGRGVTLDRRLALDPQTRSTKARMDHIHQWLLHERLLGDANTQQLWDLVHTFLSPIRYVGVNVETHDLLFDVGGGSLVGFNDLSSGQRKLILLLAEVIHHGQGKGVLLLDEPEAHFHPLWQRELRRVLTELLPEGQVIVATHSPFIIDSIPGTELFLLGEVDMERP